LEERKRRLIFREKKIQSHIKRKIEQEMDNDDEDPDRMKMTKAGWRRRGSR
jgi:hypothetical protein